MTDRDRNVLRESHDGRELKNAAISLAAGSSPEDHRLLLRYLSAADFLGRLDSPESYTRTYRDLRLGRVVQTLAENRCSSADEVLLGLIESADYQAHVLRMQLLLRALAAVRPSPPSAVAYWDRLSDPQSPIAGDVIEALVENQSEPALDLLERKFSDPAQDRENRILWMREFLLVRRNDEPLLSCCERMVTKSLPEDLKPELVDVLFDYKPGIWFMPELPPTPPARELAQENALKVLRRIGEYALQNVKLEVSQRRAVWRVVKEEGDTPKNDR
ncbi:MAG: hypothetical protein WC899_02790 [bacterium]|jgi:hypothetical protein